jgi:hypothetical protein
MMKSILYVFAASATSAFHVVSRHALQLQHRHMTMIKPLQSTDELSTIDEMCIENVAEYCLHETCDIEEYEALINRLEEQKIHFINHVATVETLLVRLKDSNRPEHDPREVQMLVDGIKKTLANPPPTSFISAF